MSLVKCEKLEHSMVELEFSVSADALEFCPWKIS